MGRDVSVLAVGLHVYVWIPNQVHSWHLRTLAMTQLTVLSSTGQIAILMSLHLVECINIARIKLLLMAVRKHFGILPNDIIIN